MRLPPRLLSSTPHEGGVGKFTTRTAPSSESTQLLAHHTRLIALTHFLLFTARHQECVLGSLDPTLTMSTSLLMQNYPHAAPHMLSVLPRYVRPQPWGPPVVLLATCAIMRFRPPPGAILAEGAAPSGGGKQKKKEA